MNNTFDYKNVRFEALRNLTVAERKGNAFMDNLGKDTLLSDEFDYDEFYKIAPRKDIFYCAATGKCYLPLKSSGNKGRFVEYISKAEQIIRDIKYVIVKDGMNTLIVSQLAHEFKGMKEVIAYASENHISDALIFNSEEQAAETLSTQPEWVKEQHIIRQIIGYYGFWRLV